MYKEKAMNRFVVGGMLIVAGILFAFFLPEIPIFLAVVVSLAGLVTMLDGWNKILGFLFCKPLGWAILCFSAFLGNASTVRSPEIGVLLLAGGVGSLFLVMVRFIAKR